jgi:hypothetical protein
VFKRAKPYKWINREITSLDPHRDYERIWHLSSVYYVNDFMMDYIYAFTFPNFLIPFHGAETVMREGTGKILHKANNRMDDTSRHMLVWWENGPSHPLTRRSVESLNKLHGYYAKQYPGNFAHDDDYIYTLCYEAAMMHRLRLRMGMKGISEHEQIAAWEFWSRMATLFVNAETGAPLPAFPSDFEAINAYMDEYEGRDWPLNPLGPQVGESVLQPFAERQFPKLLHGLARSMVLAMYNDTVLRVHNLTPPHPTITALVRFGFRCALSMNIHVLPDPELSLPEIHRRARARKNSAEPHRMQGRCPYTAHSGTSTVAPLAADEPVEVLEARRANASG